MAKPEIKSHIQPSTSSITEGFFVAKKKQSSAFTEIEDKGEPEVDTGEVALIWGTEISGCWLVVSDQETGESRITRVSEPPK